MPEGWQQSVMYLHREAEDEALQVCAGGRHLSSHAQRRDDVHHMPQPQQPAPHGTTRQASPPLTQLPPPVGLSQRHLGSRAQRRDDIRNMPQPQQPAPHEAMRSGLNPAHTTALPCRPLTKAPRQPRSAQKARPPHAAAAAACTKTSNTARA